MGEGRASLPSAELIKTVKHYHYAVRTAVRSANNTDLLISFLIIMSVMSSDVPSRHKLMQVKEKVWLLWAGCLPLPR